MLPSQLIAAIVALLRDTPTLVTALNGDATRVRAYHDQADDVPNLAEAVYAMPSPSLLVVLGDISPVSLGQGSSDGYEVEIYLRGPALFQSDGRELILDGEPASGGGNPFRYLSPVTWVDPPDAGSYQALEDSEGQDYRLLSLTYRRNQE